MALTDLDFRHKFVIDNRVFAQIQILARKFLSGTFSRFSDFLDQILAHDFGLNSFSAKIYFGRYIARTLYLFSGFHSKYTNERAFWMLS